MVSVLFVTFSSARAAAARYRVFQYLPYLKKENIRYRVFSQLSDWTTGHTISSVKFGKARKIIYYMQLALEKILRFYPILFLAARYDVVFLQRATFPLGLEKLLRLVNKNIIFDIDDSIYMPDSEEKGLIARFKRYEKAKEVARVLSVSKCVVVENSHIKNFVKKYCNNIYMITGPIDTKRNYVKPDRAGLPAITIGWIGSPSTALYLGMLDGALKSLSAKYNIKLKLIGLDDYKIAGGLKLELAAWSHKTEVSELHTFDIGIMPMPDNEWTRGKVGCKMLQYMANGIPAVVSYTPTNAEVIEDGVNGFLAHSEKDWVVKLSRLIDSAELRRGIGLAGRKSVEERYSVENSSVRFVEILRRYGPKSDSGRELPELPDDRYPLW